MIEELQNLGLSYYESKALDVILKQKINIRELSKKAGIPFGKIYSIVKGLKKKNLIKETKTRPKLIYIESASEVIDKLIKEKKEKEEKIIENIKEKVSEIDKNKGERTKFFDIGITIEDNKRIQMRTFKEAENEVLQILNIYHKPNINRESKTIWEREIERAVKRGVIFKAIYPEKIVLPKTIQKINKKHPEKFQIKRLNTDFVRCDIIDKKKVLLKLVYEDPILFGGVLFIENEKLASNLIKIFNEMWNSV